VSDFHAKHVGHRFEVGPFGRRRLRSWTGYAPRRLRKGGRDR
jgi:hypothetical protein